MYYGVGFNRRGKYPTQTNGTRVKAMVDWLNMLKRCYCEAYQKTHPSYKDCTVDPVWHDYQNFAEWHAANYIEGYELDKDSLGDGKTYKPEFCQYLTKKQNSIISAAKNFKVQDPAGRVHEVFNMTEFSAKHDLDASSMVKVCKGIRKTHKGWTRF